MKRILYIGNHLSNGGGYPSVAETMAPLLQPEFELNLVSNKKNKFFRLLNMIWAVVWHARNEQPVVIDVYSTLNFYYAFIIGFFCRILQIRYNCVLHGGNLPIRLSRNPKMCKFMFGGAKNLIAPSKYLQSAFQEYNYTVKLIPNFIFIENYPFKYRANIHPNLLWVRAFDVTYNPQMAIRILSQITKKYPEATLCMVGPDKDGSMLKCKELANQLGILGKVLFVGKLTKPEWIALSNNYDVFINTTNFDNTPVSVIEAMALGLPIVSTNVGGIPYLINENINGLLAPANDALTFSNQIEKLLESKVLSAKLSTCGREKADSLDWKRVILQWQSLLNS